MNETRAEISVVIPTLDEEAAIGDLLARLRALPGAAIEIVVADGGSADRTREIADAAGAVVISGTPGRGRQLHAGALAAHGDVIWFLHADSAPPPNAVDEIRKALAASPRVVGGNLALRFDGGSRAAAFMNVFYAAIGLVGLVYGDSGIFVRREVYERIGGFRPLPLFEDLEFVGRLRQAGRIVKIGSPLTTSSRRFENRPFVPVFLRWVLFQCLYWLGVSPERLARGYRPVRKDAAAASVE